VKKDSQLVEEGSPRNKETKEIKKPMKENIAHMINMSSEEIRGPNEGGGIIMKMGRNEGIGKVR